MRMDLKKKKGGEIEYRNGQKSQKNNQDDDDDSDKNNRLQPKETNLLYN